MKNLPKSKSKTFVVVTPLLYFLTLNKTDVLTLELHALKILLQ